LSTSTVVGNLAVELGLSDAQFRQALAHAQIQAEEAARRMQAKVNQATQQTASTATSGAWKNAGGAQSMLQFSRAIDDAQYGLRGVINNVEGIAMGLGFGAGVAGAATIAAVAIAAIGPRIAALVKATDPITELSKSLRQIQETGIAGTFVGIAQEARATQAAFEAASEALSKMQTKRVAMVGFAVEGAMADPNSGIEAPVDRVELFRRQVEVNQLAQDAARRAFEANRAKSRVTAGGLAGFEQTEAQKEQTALNQRLFQEALNKFGGGEQLAQALTIKKLADPELFGAFKEGDIEATKEVVRLLGLQAEEAKILADDFERVTGSAKELARIEMERVERQKKIEERQFREYESAVTKQSNLIDRRESMLNTMRRSEIIGASDVFGRNINAGMKSEELKQLEEINRGIQELKPITGLG